MDCVLCIKHVCIVIYLVEVIVVSITLWLGYRKSCTSNERTWYVQFGWILFTLRHVHCLSLAYYFISATNWLIYFVWRMPTQLNARSISMGSISNNKNKNRRRRVECSRRTMFNDYTTVAYRVFVFCNCVCVCFLSLQNTKNEAHMVTHCEMELN